MIYKSVKPSKDGFPVPIFSDGKAMHSLYAPEKEATKFSASAEENDFFLILGLGGAYHIKALSIKFPHAKIMALEPTEEDILFLKKNIPFLSDFLREKNISLCTAENIKTALLQNYLPALYPKFKILIHAAWKVENEALVMQIQNSIQSAFEEIKADFATQSHFGKIWQRNIILNLQTASNLRGKTYSFPIEKTALIVAAGPSLSGKIPKIKADREKYFIISTDTAFPTLTKNKIFPDSVCSLDGKFISHSHFFPYFSLSSPLYVFDLCASPLAVRLAACRTSSILFMAPSHPLVSLSVSSQKENPFLPYFFPSTNVTLMALNLACLASFKKINVVGADFGYSESRSYARGTYLDLLSVKNATKIDTHENFWAKIFFSRQLERRETGFTTKVLKAYEEEFQGACRFLKAKVTKKEQMYFLDLPGGKTKNQITSRAFDYENFAQRIEKLNNNSSLFLAALLPFLAYLFSSGKTLTKNEMLKLAYKRLISYTREK